MDKRYRARVIPLKEGRRQEDKATWEYTHAASIAQASHNLMQRYPYPNYFVEEPVEDPVRSRRTIADYEREITRAYLRGDNEEAHRIEKELYEKYPRHAIGDIPDSEENPKSNPGNPVRGNPTCRLITTSFASGFIIADELAHLKGMPEESSDIYTSLISGYTEELTAAIGSIQAHIGEHAAARIGVGLNQVEQGLKTRDLIEVQRGAEKIQEILLSEGLIAIAEECSRRE